MRIAEAIDLYLGELARLGRSARTRDDYWRKLVGLCAVAGLQKADVVR